MRINLISDTITRPTPEMRAFMMQAEVGDDVFGEDPTVNQLQDYAADLFGREAALYCSSGTMTNQIAIKLHTHALDEVICEVNSHIYQYETSGYAYNARVGINLIQGEYGKISAEQVQNSIKKKYDWLPESRLVVLESSTNRGGGNYYTLDEIKAIKSVCIEHNMRLHLDGARIFNVLVETGDSPKEIGQLFDSISICLSKGLGAPVGSLLIGDKDYIEKGRRFRKVMGGGMRQAGIIAAGGLYALQNNIERLKEDNDRAKTIGSILNSLDYVDNVKPIKTNIVIFDLKNEMADSFIERLKSNEVIAHAFGPKQVRFVTHLEFDDAQLERLEQILKDM